MLWYHDHVTKELATADGNRSIEVILISLYLRGLSRPAISPRNWRSVWACLRANSPRLGDASQCLRHGGFHEEALALNAAGLMATAETIASEGRATTVENAHLPLTWRMSTGAPAVWVEGSLPNVGRWVGAVGVRDATPSDVWFANALGPFAADQGYCLVSGGAVGCDAEVQLASSNAGSWVIEWVPFGLAWEGRWVHAPANTRISYCGPNEPFSRQTAMERNAAIYTSAAFTCVLRSHFRVGGTWHGAANALRRRQGRVGVVAREDDAAARALVALGARRITSTADISTILVALESGMDLGVCAGQRPLPGIGLAVPA